MGGRGKIAETDGAYFGGYIRPANWRENRIDRRLARNQTGKRQSGVIIRERNGNSLPMVFKSESAALSWIKSRLLPGTTLNADEAAGWDRLASKYEMRRINHQEAYSDGEACTNQAESYFSPYAGAKWVITTMSAGPTCSAMPKKARGRKMRDGLITALRCVASPN